MPNKAHREPYNIYPTKQSTEMKLKTLFILALAATCICSTARSRKKNPTEFPATAKLQPVPADTFSYAMGVAQSESLKAYLIQREGVDSAYIDHAAKALTDAATLSEAEMKQKAAYAAGLRIAEMNRTQIVPSLNEQATGKRDTTYTDLALFTRGLADGLTGKNTLSADEAVKIAERQMNYYTQQLRETNQAWLEANKKRQGVKTTPSGLQYRVLQQGTGALATDSTEVEVHYEGKLIDGTVFDSSYKRNQPATFRPNQVIKGWTEALKMMPEGSVYELYIPAELGYGERGTQNIPPNSTLIFTVELLKLK